jgi:pimeloyl-ACP methyl ester carboxylesterase
MPPAETAALEAAARRVETPCGPDGRMVWRIWGSAGALAPVLLLHGGSGSWRHWVRSIPLLTATGRQVVAPDLPGLGESDMPPPPLEPGAVAAIIASGLPAVFGEVKPHLVGFSFGAMLSGHVAALAQDRLRSLAILGAGGLDLPRAEVILTKVRDRTGEERVAAHRFNLLSLMLAEPSSVDEAALAIQEWNTVHARLRSRGFATSDTLKKALARTSLPLLALWGERDAIARDNLQARLGAVREVRPDARLAVVPGAGHWVAYEAPEPVHGELTAFWATMEG